MSEPSATAALTQVNAYCIKLDQKISCLIFLKAFQRLVAHQRVDGAVCYFNPENG